MGKGFVFNDGKLGCWHSYIEHPNNEIYTMHAHDDIEILFFISGSAEFRVEGNSYILEPNDVMIFRPAEAHVICLDENEPYERIIMGVPMSYFSEIDLDGEFLQPFFNRDPGTLNRYNASDFSTNLYQHCFYKACTKSDELSDIVRVKSYLYPLLAEIKTAYAKKKSKEPLNKGSFGFAYRVVGYINEHLYEDISLEKVSEEFFMSKSQINRIFKKAIGSTVWEYITVKRLLAARAKIRSGVSAANASIMCGFYDYSSFYRAYRSRFGCSPKEDLPTAAGRKN